MRVDLYLKLMGVTKTRMLAKRLCDRGKVFLGGKAIKPSQEVLAGETLELFLPQKELKLKIAEMPTLKSVAKSERTQFGSIEIIREL
jgi:ribosomal 50S subunit-recycling heat shock protein